MIYFLSILTGLRFIKPVLVFYTIIALLIAYYFYPNVNKSMAKHETPLTKVNFVKRFDPSRYRELESAMALFDKKYKYILGERTPCSIGISDLLFLREKVIAIMESFIHVFPSQFQHIYGRDPDIDLYEAIELYRTQSLDKIQTVHKFCNARDKSIPYTYTVTKPAVPVSGLQ